MTTGNIKRYRDGQTRKACVAAVPGLHEGLVFSYRPMLGEDSEALQALVQGRSKPDEGYRLICQELSDRITEWSEPDEITFENLRLMPYAITTAAYRMVLGVKPSDSIPGDSGAEGGDEDERIKRLRGRLVETEQAKN